MKLYKIGIRVMALGIKIGILGFLGGLAVDVCTVGTTGGLGTTIGTILGGTIGGIVFSVGAGMVAYDAYKRHRRSAPSIERNEDKDNNENSQKRTKRYIAQSKVANTSQPEVKSSYCFPFGWITDKLYQAKNNVNNISRSIAENSAEKIQKKYL